MKELLEIKVKKVVSTAKAPTKAYSSDAGWDLYASKDIKIPSSGGMAWVPTGVKLGLPKGYWAKIEAKSGFSMDKKIDIGAGVIDEGYTGEVKVLVYNFSAYPLMIIAGDKLAQFTLHRNIDANIIEVSDELEDTERGSKGFGSSGK